ncbi:MAG: translation initiation factor IF-2 [Clostridia bacterium]|nr:translation initiation factor IF-2 [Clostridia bacterium]
MLAAEAEKAAAEKAAAEKAAAEKAAAEKAAAEKAAAEKAAAEKAAAEKAAAEKAAAEKAAAEKAAAEKAAAEKAAAEKAAAEKAAAEKAAAEKAAQKASAEKAKPAQDNRGDRRPQQGDRRDDKRSFDNNQRPQSDRRSQGDRPQNGDFKGKGDGDKKFEQRGDRRPQGDRKFEDRGDRRFDKQNDRGGDKRFDGRGGKDAPQKDKGYGLDRAPLKPQPKPQIETGVEKKKTGNVRVVDTRTTNVNLSKYDEKLDSFVGDVHDNVASKQKLKKKNDNRFGGKKNDKERQAMEKLHRANIEKAKKMPLKVTIPDEISVGELASRLKVTAGEVIKRLMMMGVMANVNQEIDFDTAYLVADELGAEVTREVKVTIEEKLFGIEEVDAEEDLLPRAPVVCVMGHVDHGKTSLLDAIRNARVTAGEAGGITQHIGAYRVNLDGREITFLDTPGHEAFTAMRARGAKSTDIAILVVAADDGIMPQTIEAINHAKSAGIDIVVAINKMDKPTANPENIKAELTKYELVPEEWGGDVMCVPVSAITRQGIDDLLESVLLVAEMKELKANPARHAKGLIIEAKLDRGRGPVATVLVQNGTLRAGDTVIAGTAVGHVRAMRNDRGEIVKEAGPSVPVEITGLAEVPMAGDEFNAVEDERMARELADQRREKAKEEQFKLNSRVSLDDLFAQINEGTKELNIIVKADVGGSAEAVKASLEKLSNEEVKVRVIHSAVGGIIESDVMLAAASNAIIVGFNVRPDKSAIESAERQNVDMRTYRIIYEAIEEVSAAMKGMLAPTFKEVVIGTAEVRQTIRVPNIGIIAGCYITDGKVQRNAQIRVVRDSIVIFEDKISSLRRFKDDVREVAQGYECGIGLEKCTDIKEGDVLEAFIMEEVAR